MNDQLVAYLDGELDADTSLKVERRLAEDEDFRRYLQQLQRAWDMLDELPKSEVSNSFTQTTVEMVALSAVEELEKKEKTVHRKKLTWWVVGAGGFVTAALASYGLIAMFLMRPNEQLLRDLPVIEEIELYRVVENAEFVKELEESGLFEEEGEDAL